MSVVINPSTFARRVKHLATSLSALDEQAAPTLVVPLGRGNQDGGPQSLTVSLHLWLFGWEAPRTLLIVAPGTADTMPRALLYIKSREVQKLFDEHRKAIEEAGVQVQVRAMEVSRVGSEKQKVVKWDKALESAAQDVDLSRVARLDGEFPDQFKSVLGSAKPAADAVRRCLFTAEPEALSVAGFVSSFGVSRYIWAPVSAAITSDGEMPMHKTLSERVQEDEFLGEVEAEMKKSDTEEAGVGFNRELCIVEEAIVQSGGKIDISFEQSVDDKPVSGDTIVVSLDCLYDAMVSSISRTYMIEPSDEKKAAYEFVLALQRQIIDELIDGAVLGNIYDNASNMVASKKKADTWASGMRLAASCGSVASVHPGADIAHGSVVRVEAGMAFVVRVAIDGLQFDGQPSAMVVADTIYVGKRFDDASLNKLHDTYADTFSSELTNVSCKRPTRKARAEREIGGDVAELNAEDVRPTRLRGDGAANEMDEPTRVSHDAEVTELMARQLREAQARHGLGGDSAAGAARGAAAIAGADIPGAHTAYRNVGEYPDEAKRSRGARRLMVHGARNCLLVPINGVHVPFHISCIKSVNKEIIGSHTYLRVNFRTPGGIVSAGNEEVHKALAQMGQYAFLKDIQFRSEHSGDLNRIYDSLTAMRKTIMQRAKEEREKASLVAQDALILRKGNVPALSTIDFRPTISKGKTRGRLEIHVNGLRFLSLNGHDRVDILFNNIKHFFFQEAANTIKTVLLFELKNPIKIGKKVKNTIQIFTNVIEEVHDLGKMARGGSDMNELQEEAQERIKRTRINNEFSNFANKIKAASGGAIEVDIPFTELGFSGVPFKEEVKLLPTGACLVYLLEEPFLVLTLSEVEHVHFERVQAGLRYVDMVVIFKDYERDVQQINSIPQADLDSIKEWLKTMEIPFTQGPANLNWKGPKGVMAEIRADVNKFFEDGGWAQLADEEEEDDDEDGEDEVLSDYQPSEDQSESEYEDEEEEEDEDESEDEMSDPDAELDEEGLTWEELEQDAVREDRKQEISERRGEGVVKPGNKKARR